MADYSFSGSRIYIGPNAPKHGLRFGMGFRDGLTADMAEKCSACPSIYELIVPADDVFGSRQKAAKTGSKLNQAFSKVEEYIKGGEK